MNKDLSQYNFPSDLKKMSDRELDLLSVAIRDFLIEKVSATGGHLASNLGVVELTIALHKVFNSISVWICRRIRLSGMSVIRHMYIRYLQAEQTVSTASDSLTVSAVFQSPRKAPMMSMIQATAACPFLPLSAWQLPGI